MEQMTLNRERNQTVPSVLWMVFFLILVQNIALVAVTCAKPLKIDNSGHFIVYEDNTPFFYMADTAWRLFHRLNRDEADRYLLDREEKGFTVIQAVVIAGGNGLTQPNAYGDLVLRNKDPLRPNESYFRHVDYIVNKAEQLGLFISMLPTWGSYWSSEDPKKVIFTPDSARSFGKFIGARYKNKPIIWVMGGDHNIKNMHERKIIEAMVEGIKQGDGGNHLITFHPRGPGFSSDSFPNADWLDFNMYQSSHGAHDHDSGLFAEHDYAFTPAKPTLDGEPRYETMPVGYYFDGFNRLDRFDAYDCRQTAYWSLLAGASGHTYGHNSVWQMWEPKHKPIVPATIPWSEALDHPGAFQMGLIRRLFESRPFYKLIPNQSMIKDGPTSGGAKIRAAIASDGSFAFIYSPRGEKFTIDKEMIKGTRTNEIWFDPRYGIVHKILSPDTKCIQTYTPPTKGRGNDWVLVIDNADLKFPLPGADKHKNK